MGVRVQVVRIWRRNHLGLGLFIFLALVFMFVGMDQTIQQLHQHPNTHVHTTNKIASKLLQNSRSSTERPTFQDVLDPPEDETTGKQQLRKQITAPRFADPTSYGNRLYYNATGRPRLFDAWDEAEEALCGGNFTGYDNEFAVLGKAIVNADCCRSENKGGENLNDVIGQEEQEEFCKFSKGFILASCPKRPLYFFNQDNIKNNHLNDWLETSSVVKGNRQMKSYPVIPGVTLAVTRYEYANIYHTMSDWYNAFLVTQFLQIPPLAVNILLVDTHPGGGLDGVWSTLFNSTHRVKSLTKPVRFEKLVWSEIGYNSVMCDFDRKRLPMAEEFREFFLGRHGITELKPELDCQNLNILMIWRRDHVAHPRNPSGLVRRRFENEFEMLKALKVKYFQHNVSGIQLDSLDMRRQLWHISRTDILIGMHGAGLTHSLFLPRHAGVVEILPGTSAGAQRHFSSIAKWRRLHYSRWVNNKLDNEISNYETRIEPDKLVNMVEGMVGLVCSGFYSKKVYDQTNAIHQELLPQFNVEDLQTLDILPTV